MKYQPAIEVLLFYVFFMECYSTDARKCGGNAKADLARRHLLKSISRGKAQAGLAEIDRSPLSYYSYRTIMVRGKAMDDVGSYITQLPNLVVKKYPLLSVGK